MTLPLFKRYRACELVVWLVLLIGVLNFLPAMWSPVKLVEQSLRLKALKDVTLLLLFITGCLVRYRRKALKEFRVALAIWAVAFLGLWIALPAESLGVVASARYYIAYPLAAIAVSRLDLQDQESLRLQRGIAILGCAEAMIAVAQVFLHLGSTVYANSVVIAGHEYPRAIGSLGTPANLAMFLVLAAMVFLAAWQHGVLFARRAALWGLAIVLVGLVLTFTRTAAVAFAIGALLTSGLRRWWRNALVVAGLAGIVLLLTTARSGPGLLLGTRPERASAAWHLWTASPLTVLAGYGPGSQATVQGGELVVNQTDNFLLNLALEGGLIALVSFGAVVVTGWRAIRRTRQDPIGQVLYAGGTVFLVFTPLYLNFRAFPVALFFWMFVGIAGSRAEEGSGEPNTDDVLSADLEADNGPESLAADQAAQHRPPLGRRKNR